MKSRTIEEPPSLFSVTLRFLFCRYPGWLEFTEVKFPGPKLRVTANHPSTVMLVSFGQDTYPTAFTRPFHTHSMLQSGGAKANQQFSVSPLMLEQPISP
jgi:hypothetical protein